MMGGSDEDLAKYLDLGIDFPDFGNLDNAPSGLDTPMGRLGFEPFHQQMQMQEGTHEPLRMNLAQHENGNFDFNGMQAQNDANPPHEHGYQRQMQHPYMVPSQNYQVPLTPVSSEMHAAKYAQQFTDGNGHVVYDQYPQSFAPLVSPAQTPLEGTFSIPEYGIQQDFFSPLTSPAIEAQRGPGSTGTTASPVDLNDAPSSRVPPTSAAKRQRRKPSTATRTSGGSRSVKQSPAMKPQTRRRQQSLTKLPSGVLDELAQEARAASGLKPSSASAKGPTSSDSSVSPEPLSDSLMPPPAVPRPASRSPNVFAQTQSVEGSEPATPATLMRMPSKRASAKGVPMNARLEGDDVMEDIMLPESATRPVLSPLDTMRSPGADQDTPTLSAKAAKVSASSTPRTSAMTLSILSPDSTKRPESRANIRSGKKRQGTNSATISPALRPKISPSITPLMPASTPGMPHISAETNALYLASKSNYQNILEGTHLPGVSYPEALAENLSSKRTSHKIAEQGRRNRINTALKEIEALLPQQIMANGKKERATSTEGDETEKGASGPGTSKASTVEMAIVYIKSLQAELEVTKEKLDVAEKKAANRGSSSSQSSEGVEGVSAP
jgi:Helix-loop-helix DNA-binding domain